MIDDALASNVKQSDVMRITEVKVGLHCHRKWAILVFKVTKPYYLTGKRDDVENH